MQNVDSNLSSFLHLLISWFVYDTDLQDLLVSVNSRLPIDMDARRTYHKG